MNDPGPTAAELIERLAGLGIEEREAKLFVHLSLRGPSRASDAALATRLKRTETYRALESLMKRGFVNAHLTRPVVYEAIHPEALFQELLSGHEQRRAQLEHLRERVVAAVADAKRTEGEDEARHAYKIVQGRRAILTAVETTIRNAREIQRMVSTHFGAHNTTPKNHDYQTMLKRASEGLAMRIILRAQPGLQHAIRELLAHPNVEVRYAELDHPLRFVLIDGREVVYWLVNDSSPHLDATGDVAMWTNAPDFILAQETFFDTLWSSAQQAPEDMDRQAV